MTKSNKKQLKINKLFNKLANPEDNNAELLEEINQLECKLKEKQEELFKAQKNNMKRKVAPHKEKINPAIRSEKIVLWNKKNSLERSLDLLSLLTGTEVKSYEVDNNCVILYHMQHHSKHKITHGLKINKQAGKHMVTKFSLPVGFNFNAVMEKYDNIMTQECLSEIRRALVAYYDRMEQFEKLKSLLSLEANVFKTLDGSHMEVSFTVESEEEGLQELVLTLEYRVHDIRPKSYNFKETNLSDHGLDRLSSQCAILKHKPLHKAFKQCFIDGIGHFKMPRAEAPEPGERRPKSLPVTNKYNHNNDDTYVPEWVASDDDGDDDEDQLRHAYQ